MSCQRRRKSPSTSSKAFSTTSPASADRLQYHVAASFIGKDRPYDPSSHVFHFNPYNRMQPPRTRRRSLRPDSGHDAFFVSRVNDSGSVAFGVADGVGGWTDSGVDPADFSHGLCDFMAASAYEHDASASRQTLTARRLMQTGYDALCRDGSVKAGGSTACVGIAAPDGSVEVANLGDSGFLQLRLNAINAYSEAQTHAFNTPFQLSLIPPSAAARMAAFGGAQLSDLPRDAGVTQHTARHGDVLLFATDGVLDNLFNHDILRIASRVMVSRGAWVRTPSGGVRVGDALDALTRSVLLPSSSSSPPPSHDGAAARRAPTTTLQSLLATELVGAAKAASVNAKVDGPFAKEVQKYYPHEQWRGGKVDDICVVVVVVVSENATSATRSTSSKL
ncbi:5-azacytidine resistance protein azr1 [Moelleriella libera RCEF 2490]|uniref:Protein phosphatase n=1 Tax=Moelleriella libera RCEF 2490 TaxID=1081109 RepID=A0A162I9X4_9HYPO|nr:5-azacytidine resistance protein azr1 [Moelleriella libera RCEF 2490]